MFVLLTTGIISLNIFLSLRWVWTYKRDPKQSITFDNFFLLFMTYIIVLVGFGFIYTNFTINGIWILKELEAPLHGTYFDVFESSMYFSAVTLFSVGYGDITPIGIGRWFAIIEALIGYIMPAGFVVRTVMDFESKE